MYAFKWRFRTTCRTRYVLAVVAALCLVAMGGQSVHAQSVCLPAPRLLTILPMGGQVGTEFDVTISGQHAEDVEALVFSHPAISAEPVVDDAGNVQPNRFHVTVGNDCPTGVHEARVLCRLGLSSARAFSVGELSEVTQSGSSVDVASAFPLEINSICNATLPVRAINHYSFQAKQGQRVIVDCAAKGIDSKTNPVLVIADAKGQDLIVERRGGLLDFVPESDGPHIIKVHDLTFKGGPECFYRLAIWEAEPDTKVERLPSVRAVGRFSWPPEGLGDVASMQEAEPNNKHHDAQQISLPCDIAGSFYPAADVDTFEFDAKAGETWWVEVASERLGRPTDPSIIVQQVVGAGENESLVDVVELTDIASPMKRSSNGYSYDGPPYNAGSADILGSIQIKEDGRYRLQLSDLFGGTRNDASNIYRLIVRKAAPDFVLVAWALHMELRNGDRNALSKPISLRGGATMALEVVAIRRDGFDGEIQLAMSNLPGGVTASGVHIPAGQSKGIMLVTAHQDAPRGMSLAEFTGTAIVEGVEVTRHVQLAAMAWPVGNAWTEIPTPRLMSNVPVSVGGTEFAGISIAPSEEKVWEVSPGETLRIPLSHIRRGDFSGTTINLRTFGAGMEGNPRFDISIASDQSEAVLNLSRLKPPPGDYVLAFYGSAVAKYRYNPEGVVEAEANLKQLKAEAARIAEEAAEATALVTAAAPEEKTAAETTANEVAERKKQADLAVANATKHLQTVTRLAQPKDIADIVVTAPITIRVKPVETTE